jgi:hypothetical protein
MVLLLPALAACAAPPSSNNAMNDMALPARAPDNPSAASLQQRLAITHRFTLRVPSAETEAIQQRHMAECTKLGCTILSTSIDRSNELRRLRRRAGRAAGENHDARAVGRRSGAADIRG